MSNCGDECNKDNVTISRYEYQTLIKANCLLGALQLFGVDNWEGYDLAMRNYRQQLEEEGLNEVSN